MEIQRELFEHQEEGVEKALENFKNDRSFSLNDEMGLGKTATAIVATSKYLVEEKKQKRSKVLVVCPTSVMKQWSKEVVNFLGKKYDPMFYHGSEKTDLNKKLKKNKNKIQFIVTSYGSVASEAKNIWNKADFLDDLDNIDEMIELYSPLFKNKWDMLIIDESHTIKNFKGIQFMAVNALEREKTFLTTGTPFNNEPKDMVSQVMLMRIPPPKVSDTSIFSSNDKISERVKNKKLQWIFNDCSDLDKRDMIMINHKTEKINEKRTIFDSIKNSIENYSDIIDNMNLNKTNISNLKKKTEKIKEKYMFYEKNRKSVNDLKKCGSSQGYLLEFFQTILSLEKNELLLEIFTDDGINKLVQRKRKIDQWTNFWQAVLGNSDCYTAKNISKEINEKYMLRRAKNDVPEIYADIPNMEIINEEVEMYDSEVLRYNDFIRKITRIDVNSNINSTQVFSSIIHLRQITSSPIIPYSGKSVIKDKEGKKYSFKEILGKRKTNGKVGKKINQNMNEITKEIIGEFNFDVEESNYTEKELTNFFENTNLEAKTAKFNYVIKTAEELNPKNRKLIIFSEFTVEILLLSEILENAGISTICYDGSMSVNKRNETIKKFENDEINVLLISMGSGSVGLNLVMAQTVMFMGPSWNPFGNELQAMKRIYRIGQTEKTRAIFLYSKKNGIGKKIKTIDHIIGELQDNKLLMAKYLLSDDYLTDNQSSKISNKNLNLNIRNLIQKLTDESIELKRYCEYIETGTVKN